MYTLENKLEYPGGSSPGFRLSYGYWEDDSTGSAFYVDTNGYIQAVSAASPLYVQSKFWSMGSWGQMCAYPYDPGKWTLNAGSRSINGVIDDFTGYYITDNGAAWNGVYLYKSLTNGNPSGKQYFSILYKYDSSGIGRIYCKDDTSGLTSILLSDGNTWSVDLSLAGAIEVYDFETSFGVRCILVSIDWNVPSNDLSITITPGSTTNKSIIVYACPYINELGHIWPFTGPGATTIASRAGTTNVPMLVGGKLYSLLDGKADGSELVTNGTFDTDTGWIKGIGWSISSGKANFNGSAYNALRQDLGLDESFYYEVSFDYNISLGRVRCQIGGKTIVTNLIGSGTQKVRSYPTTGGSYGGYISFFSNDTAIFSIDNISVKQISPASFKLKFDWTPSFSYSGIPVSTTGCIPYGGTQNLLQFRTDGSGNGFIDLLDGTNTVSVALDWEAFTSYSIEVLVGDNHPSYVGVDKMQLIVGATASSVSDFDGSFDPDTTIVLGELTDYPQAISPLVFDNVKEGDWE